MREERERKKKGLQNNSLGKYGKEKSIFQYSIKYSFFIMYVDYYPGKKKIIPGWLNHNIRRKKGKQELGDKSSNSQNAVKKLKKRREAPQNQQSVM